MEHRYHLEGTLNELQDILQNQFDLDESKARFYMCILLMDQQQFMCEFSDMQSALWHLKSNTKYTTPILKSRFSICFTDLKKKLLDQLFVQFGGMLIDGDAFAFSTVISWLLAIYRSCTYIKKTECCVYYQALSWKAIHPSQEYFGVKDILPNVSDETCCHLDYIHDKKWKCFYCHNDKCSITEGKCQSILTELCKRNVFIECNGMYRFSK